MSLGGRVIHMTAIRHIIGTIEASRLIIILQTVAFIEIETAKQIQKNEVFMDLCKMTADYTTPVLLGDPLEVAVKSFSLSKRNTIPNLLSKEFAIK